MTNIEESIVEGVEEDIKPKTWKQTLWNITKTVLKIVITAALLYYVFKKVPYASVEARFVHANYWWMLAGVAFYFASMVASSWRLLSFFKSINLRLDPRFNFRLYLLGIFYNFLLPGGIGGDGYKIYLLNKTYKLPAKKVFWAILFDRLSGLWAIGLIIVCLKVFIPQIPIHFAIPASIFVVGSIVYYVVVRVFFKEFGKHFFKGHAKAVVVQAFQVLTIIMILLGQDFTGKFAPYLLAFLVSALAAVVPINIGGAGARELVFQKSAGFFHIDASLGIYLSISFFLISLLVALSGIYYLIRPSRLQEGLPKAEEIKE
ncbi:lysylphosphatidylglycerol synthase transmembrane domain-containing protein [Mucilaginibacter sp.]